MSSFYKLEVHYLDYEVIGVTAITEREAHDKAKAMFESSSDHIIGVTTIGTVEVDGEEIDNEYGTHTTEYMTAE